MPHHAVHLRVTTLAIAFASTAYSASVFQVTERFRVSDEVATLGISLCVLGFTIGPLVRLTAGRFSS